MKVPILWTIAFRNLREHTRRTLTVGGIMAFGILLLMLGNSFLDAATQGLRSTYIEKYTGDLYLTSHTSQEVTVFGAGGGMGPLGGGSKVENLPDPQAIETVLKADSRVVSWNFHTPLTAQILIGEEAQGFGRFLGVDPAPYQANFPKTVVFEQGGFWKVGEHGLVLNADTWKSLADEGQPLPQVGDTIAIGTLGEGKIREVTLTGIARPTSSGGGPFGSASWVDIDTIRFLNGETLEAGTEKSKTSETTIANPVSEDDLFGDSPSEAPPQSSGVNLTSVINGGLGERKPEVADPKAWFIATLILKPGVDAKMVQMDLTRALATAHLEVDVRDWVQGAGSQVTTVLALKSLFNFVILIIALVAIFIVMNALMISVSERTSEIGTMRAVGAKRKTVRNMILLETFFLSVGAGLLGIAVATVLITILGFTGVPLSSDLFRMLFGSDSIRPVLTPGLALQSFGLLIVIGLVSGWYPSRVALKMSPLKAIQSE